MRIFSRNWVCDKFKIVLVIFFILNGTMENIKCFQSVKMLIQNHIIKSRTFIIDLFQVGVKD